jgi:hypothetical protein
MIRLYPRISPKSEEMERRNPEGKKGIFYLNGLKTDLNYRNGLRVNLFSQTA